MWLLQERAIILLQEPAHQTMRLPLDITLASYLYSE